MGLEADVSIASLGYQAVFSSPGYLGLNLPSSHHSQVI
jgi:hypothetical protein